MTNAVSPVIELTENEGVYTFTSNFIVKSFVITFKMGEEFDEETPDGRKVRTTMTQEGNKLIQDQKGEKSTKIVHEFTPEFVTMVSKNLNFDVFVSKTKSVFLSRGPIFEHLLSFFQTCC